MRRSRPCAGICVPRHRKADAAVSESPKPCGMSCWRGQRSKDTNVVSCLVEKIVGCSKQHDCCVCVYDVDLF